VNTTNSQCQRIATVVWYEIESIGKMQMQTQSGGPFEITWE
jgi:hypothetical protein